MRAQLRRIGAFLKTFWWVIVLVLAVVGIGWIYWVKKKSRKQIEDAAKDEAPSLVRSAANRVQSAVTDVKVETAIIKTKSEEQRRDLEEIRQEPDGKKRRERLAALLKDSL